MTTPHEFEQSTSSSTQMGPDLQYRVYLDAGEFRIQECDSCRTQTFPPRVVCPGCGTASLIWRRPAGTGVVYASTVVRQRPEKGGDYNVSVVQLSEGARMMTRIDGIEPEAVCIGARVRVRITTDGDHAIPTFVVAEVVQ